MSLRILSCGPGLTVQDMGRPGRMAEGLSRGGAADRVALHEGAALLGHRPERAAVEMMGFGGTFSVEAPVVVALTGAPMQAALDGAPLEWNASHALEPGQTLRIGAATKGFFGYLHLGGGVAGEPFLGSLSAHVGAGIGRTLRQGDVIAGQGGGTPGMGLDPEPRLGGGTLRVLSGPQTAKFSEADRTRFEATPFTRDRRGNRQGVRFDPEDGEGYFAEGGLTVLSEVIVPGDIQVTGEGSPYVLLAECQTTGGYPRIGAVVPADLPRAAQAAPGDTVRFQFITAEEGLALHRAEAKMLASLPRRVAPRIRDPKDMADLLTYDLIGRAALEDT